MLLLFFVELESRNLLLHLLNSLDRLSRGAGLLDGSALRLFLVNFDQHSLAFFDLRLFNNSGVGTVACGRDHCHVLSGVLGR